MQQQESKAINVAILRAAVTRSIAIYVLRIDVAASEDQSLDDAQISANACNVQRCAEIGRARVL